MSPLLYSVTCLHYNIPTLDCTCVYRQENKGTYVTVVLVPKKCGVFKNETQKSYNNIRNVDIHHYRMVTWLLRINWRLLCQHTYVTMSSVYYIGYDYRDQICV